MQPIIPGPIVTPPTSLTLTGSPPDLRAWQVGQLLQAQVLTGTVNNQVTLRIGQTTLAAQTQAPLTPGQTLTVQVLRLGDQPTLKILPQAPPPVLTDPLTAALRSALPRQTGLAPLLANLGLLAQAAHGGDTPPPPLPTPVLQAAAQIYRDLSDSHQAATARGLQQAIRDTGLFLESKLAQLTGGVSTELGTDFKAALLRLQTLLNDTPRPATLPPAATPAGAAPEQSTATPPREPVTANTAPPLRGEPAQSQSPENPRPTTPSATPASPSTGQSTAAPPHEPVTANTALLLRGLPVQPLSTAGTPQPTTSPAAAATSTRPPPGEGTTAPPRDPVAAAHPAPPLRGMPVQAQAASAPSLASLPLAGSALHELQQQTEGSLARLQLNQLASVPHGTEPQPSWLLELPLRHQDQVNLFHLRIGRESQAHTDAVTAERPWVVNLAFDLPGLGPVQARVAVIGEQVSTTFWAERAGTSQAFHSHLETLRQNLQQAGLGVGDLVCRTGQAPQPPTGPRAPLMDTRA